MTNIAVIHYSSTGHVHRLAHAIAEGAEETGAQVRVLRVAELAPAEVIASQPAWQAHVDAVADEPVATVDDLEWADGIALGSPARFGLPAAQLKQFIDTTGGLWARGGLADKAVSAFTSAQNDHGGQESVLLALGNVAYHWGAALVPPGYTDESVFGAGGNPYGTSYTVGTGTPELPEAVRTAARHQGRRLARYAAALAALRTEASVA